MLVETLPLDNECLVNYSMSNRDHRQHGIVEEVFESILFSCRFLVLFAVLGILCASVVMFLKGCVEVVQGVKAFHARVNIFQPTSADDNSVILAFIPAVDNYLFATILVIISMGLYELFISEIDPKIRRGSRPIWLKVHDLDDLTSRIGEVVIMILIVNFFKQSFSVPYGSPIDLLILGGGVLLVSGSLVVAHHVSGKRKRLTGSSDGSSQHD
jgi:uncharacterized membrane protein YqhA